MLDFGILGMNARNLSYISKYNDKKGIRLANHKQKTKRFLQARGIPVPTTFDMIVTHDQLWSYDFSQLPVDDFIIKPAKGSRGRGIYRVKHLGENEHEETILPTFNKFSLEKLFIKQSPFKDRKYKVSGKVIDDTTLRRYLLDILYGKNSMTGAQDEIMIEELLVPGGGFEQYCEHGLADIRVIVFNMIPVAAMLRVPTIQSDGKANLDRGALAVGVEVGSGKIYGMYQNGTIHRNHFPHPYQGFAHQTIPYWDEILSYSSKIQYFTKLGYVGLDWVITEDGPKLLEMNARAGMKFQLATQLPIKKRLEKIGDVKIVTPEKGVEIAQTLFSHQKSQVLTRSKVLYLTQHGTLKIYNEDIKKEINAIVEVDLKKRNNYCSSDIWKHLKEEKSTNLKLTHSIQFDDLVWKCSKKLEKNKVILGRNAVEEYYVKPIHKIFTKLDFINPKNLFKNEVDEIHILDQRLYKLSKILNISKILSPVNFLEELDTFVTWNGRYNPHFQYRRPTDKKLNQIEDDLLLMQEKYFGTSSLQSNFAQLYKFKIEELLKKLLLIRSYKKQNTNRIITANESLFGKLDNDLIFEAQNKFFKSQFQDKSLLGPVLKRQQVYEIIKKHVALRNIPDVKIQFDSNGLSRMSVKRGKQLIIRISEGVGFREKELLSILAHEVDIHIKRYQAGYETGWRLLQLGTSGYISDEEGLAILESETYLPDNFEKIGMYEKYYLLSISGEKTFSELVGIIRGMTNKSLMGAYKGALRLKKGLCDTANRGGVVYLKDKVYLEGYTTIKKWIAEGGNKDDLMIGKIKIEDLPYIK